MDLSQRTKNQQWKNRKAPLILNMLLDTFGVQFFMKRNFHEVSEILPENKSLTKFVHLKRNDK